MGLACAQHQRTFHVGRASCQERLWVNNMVQSGTLANGNKKKPAVPWWFDFDPTPPKKIKRRRGKCELQVVGKQLRCWCFQLYDLTSHRLPVLPSPSVFLLPYGNFPVVALVPWFFDIGALTLPTKGSGNFLVHPSRHGSFAHKNGCEFSGAQRFFLWFSCCPLSHPTKGGTKQETPNCRYLLVDRAALAVRFSSRITTLSEVTRKQGAPES